MICSVCYTATTTQSHLVICFSLSHFIICFFRSPSLPIFVFTSHRITGKALVAEVVKDKKAAFEKLDALKVFLHQEFMQSLLTLGDQIEQHEHDAWASFHLRFSPNRRESTSVVPRTRGRQSSVLLIKQKLTIPPAQAPLPKKKLTRVVVVEDELLGSCKKVVEYEDKSSMSGLSGAGAGPGSTSSVLQKRKNKRNSPTRVGLAPLVEDEDKTDKALEDRVKFMIMNMTASATQNTTKAKLTRRLALVKAQKTRQQNEAFVIGAKAHFECLLFELCINAKMLDYMDREKAILENKIFTQINTVKKAQSIQHSKDLGAAIKNNSSDQEILALEVDLQKRKEKLHNKLNHRKERKRKEFDDAKANTLEKLKDKLEDINLESTAATLTPTASAKLKGISLLYKLLQSE